MTPHGAYRRRFASQLRPSNELTRARAKSQCPGVNLPTLVVFDLETGGLETHRPIIQIAAIAVDVDFKRTRSF